MTRRKKWLLGSAGTLVLGFVGGVGPWPLDKTPEAEPETEALAIVEREATAMQKRHAERLPGRFHAGWAAEPFDLPAGVPLAGYGARRGAASEGYLFSEQLGARTVVMDIFGGNDGEEGSVAVVCADLLLINASIADAVSADIQERYGSWGPQLVFTATHTHSGPGGWGEMALEELIAGEYDPAVKAEIIRAITASIDDAIDHMGPASYGWLELQSPRYLRNRTLKGGDVDATLEALVLQRRGLTAGGEEDKNKQTAVLALFGAHATCLGDENLLLSGDYPGAVVDHLEAGRQIDFAAFAGGCMGSHSPVVQHDSEKLRHVQMGAELASLIVGQLDSVKFREQARLSSGGFELPTPDLQMRVGKSWRLSPVATGLIHEPRANISTFRLDDHLWVGVPFEVSGMLSRPLREQARQAGFEGLTISSFQGDYLGYLIPDSIYAEGEKYEAQMSFLGPSGGSYFVDVIETFVENQKAMAPPSPPL